jgi:hypothetical protein
VRHSKKQQDGGEQSKACERESHNCSGQHSGHNFQGMVIATDVQNRPEQSEIGDPPLTEAVNKSVGRFQVAMQDQPGMRGS